jgi:hypothetical protein
MILWSGGILSVSTVTTILNRSSAPGAAFRHVFFAFKCLSLLSVAVVPFVLERRGT